MNSQTRDNINYFLENFSSGIINNLIKSLQNDTLTLSSNDFELIEKLNIASSEVSTIKEIFKDFKTVDIIITTITLLNEIKQLEETKLRSTKLVSTTPKLFHEGSDKTDLMFKELFLKAEKSITIVGYVMTNDKHVKEIFEIIKSNPSIKKLDIKFIFDTAEESKEWGMKTPSVKKIIQSNWGDEKPFPKIFTYKDKKSSLHAKVLIIDSKEILITSANMTGRGMQRNLEMGIYHKGQPAKEAENLIQELIHDGYFNRV